MTLFPLTPGLLASAALRANHAVFMPDFDAISSFIMRPWMERIPEALEDSLAAYKEAKAGTLSDLQILEEFNGNGFYQADREDMYLAMLRKFPGMREKAEILIAQEILNE